VKADRIQQFNLFLWGNKSDKIFYLDNVRLLPSAALGKKGQSIATDEFLPAKGEKIYKTGDYFSFARRLGRR